MKQAILITAYHQMDLLRKIIAFFDDDFDIYIHVDKKCKEYYGDIATERVHIYSKYRIYWGSEYHLFAIMFLVSEAHKNGPYSYYHLITGNDFPIKPLSEFKSFFSENNHTNYLEYYKLPRPSWPNEGGLGRIKYFWIGNQWCDTRKHSRITNLLLKIQRKLGVRRKFVCRFPIVYGGGTYWSLTQDAIERLLANKCDIRVMRFTHCSEEIFVHTMLMNNNDGLAFENDSLRYMKWKEHSSSPEVLGAESLANILNVRGFFARKVDIDVSSEIIDFFENKYDCSAAYPQQQDCYR